MCPQEEKVTLLDHEGCYPTVSKEWLWLDPLVLPLVVLWLNGIFDCTLLGFFNPRVGVLGS